MYLVLFLSLPLVANVICWLKPTWNKAYIILSYLQLLLLPNILVISTEHHDAFPPSIPAKKWWPGGRLNIKMSSYQYRDSHVKDKTVSPTVLSLTWKSPYLGETVFILRRGPDVPSQGVGHVFTCHHSQYTCDPSHVIEIMENQTKFVNWHAMAMETPVKKWPLLAEAKMTHLVVYTCKYLHHDDVIKWKHFPHYWPFVRGIHRSRVNFPQKG